MRRATFLRRMASAAMAGMLGVRLELGRPELESDLLFEGESLFKPLEDHAGMEWYVRDYMSVIVSEGHGRLTGVTVEAVDHEKGTITLSDVIE